MALTRLRTEVVLNVGEGARSTPASSSPHQGAARAAASAPAPEMESAIAKPSYPSMAPKTNVKQSTSKTTAEPNNSPAATQPISSSHTRIDTRIETNTAMSLSKIRDNAQVQAHLAPAEAVSVSKAPGKSKTSAMDALCAIKESQAQATQSDGPNRTSSVKQSALRPSRNTPAPAIERSPLQERDKSLKTSAQGQPHMKQSEQRPTTGKLPSRKNAMLSQTPGYAPSKAVTEDFSELEDAAVDASGITQTKDKGKNSSARPAKAGNTSKDPAIDTKSASRPLSRIAGSRPAHESKAKRQRGEVEIADEAVANLEHRLDGRTPDLRDDARVHGTLKRPTRSLGVPMSSLRPAYDVPSSPGRRTKRRRVQDAPAPAKPSSRVKAQHNQSKVEKLQTAKETSPHRAQKIEESNIFKEPMARKGQDLAKEATALRRSARNAAKSSKYGSDRSSHALTSTASRSKAGTNGLDEVRADQGYAWMAVEDLQQAANEEAPNLRSKDAGERLSNCDNAPDHTDRPAAQTHFDAATPPMRSGSIVPGTIPRTGKKHIAAAKEPPVVTRTPAGLPSSPPQCTSMGKSGLNRSTIIGFDRTGPLNQGSTLIKTKETDVALANGNKTPSRSALNSTNAQVHGLGGHGPSSVATMRTTKSIRVPPAAPRNIAPCVDDALGGFLRGPQANMPTPTRHVQPKAVKAAIVAPSPSGDNEFQFVDDLEGPTLVEQHPPSSKNVTSKATSDRTASQILMPPPVNGTMMTETQKPSHEQAAASKDILSVDIRSQSQEVGICKSSQMAHAKRAIEFIHEDAPALKRPKMGTDAQSAAQDDCVPGQNDDRPAAAADMQDSISKLPILEPDKRTVRKVGRHSTQGTVDLGGSPVPKDHEYVDGFETVLEQYSAQAKLSSDHVKHRDLSSYKPAAFITRQLSQAELSQNELPPSHQPHARSSNSKTKPASPGQDSQAITDVAIQVVDPQQLVVRDAGAGPATDPFTSSEEVKLKTSKQNASSPAAGRLRPMLPFAIKPSSSQQEAPRLDSEAVVIESRAVRHRTTTISSNESSAFDSPEPPTSNLEDLSTWRDGLMSHQLNLFHELVAVSHRLVQHLVDRETAARHIVEDYRRRGLRLVQRMEREHSRDFAAYSLDFEQRKKMLRDSLGTYSGQLQASMEMVKESKAERSKRATKRAELDKRLSKLVAKCQ